MHRPRLTGGCRVLLKLFDNFVSLLATITRVVCILMTMALFAIVIAAIVARYGFGQAVSWTEEVPRYLLIWISFLAAARLASSDAIMSASMFCSMRSRRGRVALSACS
jgi:TRAP-type C4-dicarboxylate transport system permease small subunit